MEIIIAEYDDWQGLYVNDVLVTQGHQVRLWDIIEEIKKYYPINFRYKSVDGIWLDEMGDLPENLDEVRFEND